MGGKLRTVLKNKKGVTLMEMIVCMMILSIFMTSVVTVIGPVLRMFVMEKELSDTSVLVNSIADEITNELAYAKKIDAINGDSVEFEKYGGYKITFAVDADGHLVKNDARVFDTGYYHGNKITLDFGADASTEDKVFDITIAVSGRVTYNRTFSVALIEQ